MMDAVRRRRRMFATKMRAAAARATRPDVLKTMVRSVVGSTVAMLCFGIYAIHLSTQTTSGGNTTSTPHAFFAGYESKVPARAKTAFNGVWWNLLLYLPTAVSCLTKTSTTINSLARTIITLAGTAVLMIFFVKSTDIGLLLAAVCVYIFVSNNNMATRVGSMTVFVAFCATEVIKFK